MTGDREPGFDALVHEIGELARREPDRIPIRLADRSLHEQAELCLRLPAAERLELLLHAPRPMRLVRTLPDFELYLTVREVGPTDALPLVALASAQQLTHLTDLESWRGDDFDPRRSGAWVALLLESGEPALTRFLRAADDELLVALLQKWARVRQIEIDDTPDKHGAGETEAGTEAGFITPDGYHRFSPVIPEHGPAIRRMAELLAQDSPERYQRLLSSALWEVPLEIEQQALHWRQSRLEEHGFPPPDEAVNVYAPPAGTPRAPVVVEAGSGGGPAAPRTALRVLEPSHPLARATSRLADEERERALIELAALAARIVVADAADTGDPEGHRRALRKAGDFIGIGLAARHADDPGAAAGVIREVPLIELFREGYARAVELQVRARRLKHEGWAAAHPQALDLLDAPLRASVAGLLQRRPLHFDSRAGADEQAYRDFSSAAELDEADNALRLAEVLGAVMVEQLGLDIGAALEAEQATPLGPPRFGTLFLTALAWHALEKRLRCSPLSQEQVSRFLRTVASTLTAEPGAAPRAMAGLIDRVATETSLDRAQAAVLEAYGRACLETLHQECGQLDPGNPVDPRFVSCLLIEP